MTIAPGTCFFPATLTSQRLPPRIRHTESGRIGTSSGGSDKPASCEARLRPAPFTSMISSSHSQWAVRPQPDETTLQDGLSLAQPAIALVIAALEILSVIYSTVVIERRAPRAGLAARTFAISAYGEDAAQAHELVLLCLTAATHPVLVTADGEVVRIPSRRLRAVITYAEAHRPE